MNHLPDKPPGQTGKLSADQHMIRIQALLIQVLTGRTTEPGLHAIIHYLVQIIQADWGYFFFGADGKVISVDFYQRGDARNLMVGDGSVPANLPLKIVLRTGAHTSAFGRLPLNSSVYLPLVENETLAGAMELGLTEGQLDHDRIQMLSTVLNKLLPVLLTLRQRLIADRQSRTLARRLDERDGMYNILLDKTRDLICTFGSDRVIHSINRPGRELLGLDPAVERPILALQNPAMEVLQEMLQTEGYLNDMEVVLESPSRGELFCLACLSPVFDDRNEITAIHGVFKDISERVDAQRQMVQANVALNKLNRQLEESAAQLLQQEKLASIGMLSAGIAHEINNPLGFIQSNHLTLKRYLEKIDTYIKTLEENIPNASRIRLALKMDKIFTDLPVLIGESDEGLSRITRIVRSLKDFSRIDAKGAATAMDINKALEDTLVVSRNSWKYVAEVRTEFQLSQTVECLGDEINQVFLNMIVNAAQAIEGQKRGSPGKITIRTGEERNMAIISIEDDGPGIPPELRSKIFDPFFTTKPIGQGTGLGLSISWDIVVNRHCGQLSVEEVPDGGTRFLIKIPFLYAANASDTLDVP